MLVSFGTFVANKARISRKERRVKDEFVVRKTKTNSIHQIQLEWMTSRREKACQQNLRKCSFSWCQFPNFSYELIIFTHVTQINSNEYFFEIIINGPNFYSTSFLWSKLVFDLLFIGPKIHLSKFIFLYKFLNSRIPFNFHLAKSFIVLIINENLSRC